MESKIMLVFYGNDCLPYKDKERTVHYPVTGGSFLGASNVTKIRFYIDRIGSVSDTWVANAKLPNGKMGNKILEGSTDELGEYVELQLSSFYTQAKGDVYISLNGFAGGVEIDYDSVTEQYSISGVPTIQATGAIKLAINYATPLINASEELDDITLTQLLALLGTKLPKDSHKYLKVIDSLATLNTTVNEEYVSNTDIVYSINEKQFYAISGTYPSLVATAITLELSNLNVTNLNASNLYALQYIVESFDYVKDIDDQTLRDFIHSLISFYAYSKAETDTKLNGKQNTLVSGVNIKTINNNSLLGSGNIDIQGTGGNAEWGQITGTLSDQTDLNDQLQDIREIAEGKCKAFVLSYQDTIASAKENLGIYPGSFFVWNNTTKEFEDKKAELLKGDYDNVSLTNSNFNSQNATIQVYSGLLLKSIGGKDTFNVPPMTYYLFTDIIGGLHNVANIGDVLYVLETDVPDRWVSYLGTPPAFTILETTKVDLSAYVTTSALNTAINGVNDNIAPAYDNTLTYTTGEVVIYNGKLYKCTTAITTAEEWDNTHWDLVSVASDFVNLTGTQTISGAKTFSNGISIGTGSQLTQTGDGSLTATLSGDGKSFKPSWGGHYNIGAAGYKWKDGHFSGTIYTPTIEGATYNEAVDDIYTTINNFSESSANTEIKWSKMLSFSKSANTTFTFETAKTNCLNEYKAIITNSGANAITITLTGVSKIKTNDSNITIVEGTDSTFTLPANASVEMNIQNGKAIVFNWDI